MAYNPATDFVGLWRNSGGQASKAEMPGLDFVVAALARAGMINLSVSATAPTANQSTTAWLHAATPSAGAEGALNLWNPVTSAYNAATPALFLDFLQACAGQSGVAWWVVTGVPGNTIGNNGDLAIRMDEPGGIYGPKTAGAWPLTPIPGTADIVSSTSLDNTFGTAEGAIIYRDAALWKARQLGAPNTILASLSSVPNWETLSALLDAVFSTTQGSILYRDAALWEALPPDTAGRVLSTGGTGGNPSWASKTPEFDSGVVMVFQQTTAPTGWTKQTSLNDVGLRVVTGAVGSTAGSAFSTVFAQTVVGDTALTEAQIPPHTHSTQVPNSTPGQTGGGVFPATTGGTTTTTGSTGGGLGHHHTVNLALAYVDVIIATKN